MQNTAAFALRASTALSGARYKYAMTSSPASCCIKRLHASISPRNVKLLFSISSAMPSYEFSPPNINATLGRGCCARPGRSGARDTLRKGRTIDEVCWARAMAPRRFRSCEMERATTAARQQRAAAAGAATTVPRVLRGPKNAAMLARLRRARPSGALASVALPMFFMCHSAVADKQ